MKNNIGSYEVFVIRIKILPRKEVQRHFFFSTNIVLSDEQEYHTEVIFCFLRSFLTNTGVRVS